MATQPATKANLNNTKPSSLHVEPAVSASLPEPSPLRKIIAIASIAAGVQFGWALQLSLLTPYVQLLGIPHKWASFIWLCGPISGTLFQPIVDYHSHRCTSSVLGVAALLLQRVRSKSASPCSSSSMGLLFGNSLEKKSRPRAVAIFVVGFWILDMANNTLQGTCPALLTDLAAGNHSKTRTANAFFSLLMAVGNVLGCAAGSYSKLHLVCSFTKTKACNEYCANMKSRFFLSIALLAGLAALALFSVQRIFNFTIKFGKLII